MKGKTYKNKTILPNHPCTYADFYYKYNDSIDFLNLKAYRCLENYGHLIKGIYTDQIFSYYEFTVMAKDLKDETFSNIDEYLFNTDCKLQIYYTDITIDLENYKQPISPYLNSVFVQLNPTLFIKRNMYYMNQYLSDDDLLFGVFGEEAAPSKKEILYSRYEEYSLYLGLNRSTTKYPNYQNYAKFYLRADTKKTEIRRTYQKVVEFFADASSLLVAIYDLLLIIFNYINNFYAEYSLGKKIFFFKELDDNHFHISKKYSQIKELLSLNTKKNVNKKSIVNKSKEKCNTEFLYSKNDINIYSNKRVINDNNLDKKTIKDKTEIKKKKPLIIQKANKIYDFPVSIKEMEDNSKNSFSNNFLNSKQKPNINHYNNSTLFKIKKISINDNNNKNLINYSFNIFEIVLSSFCGCLIPKNMKLKADLKEKANNILNDKLDVIVYVRNMILFEILNETILSDSKKDIINFLCRPTLSNNKIVKSKFVNFYHSYKEDDFEKFSNRYKELIKQSNKEERELKLISLTEEKLKDIIEEDKS